MHLREVRVGPSGTQETKEYQGFSDILERFIQILEEYSGELTRSGYSKNHFRVIFRGCGQEFDWQVESEDETRLNILYLFFTYFYAIKKGGILPEGQAVWRRMRYEGTSPEKLADSELYRHPIYSRKALANRPPLTAALLYALNIKFEERWRDGKVSARQIAEAWCLAEEYGVGFEEALAA